MKRVAVLGVLSLSMAMAGAASANPTVGKSTKSGVRVVAGAKMLSLAEKSDVTGKGDCCGCSCTPETPPVPQDEKPGYGFGTTGHYGPPGQGFNPSSEGGPTWRGWRLTNSTTTPAGHHLPGQALVRP